jgi:hypothetical protein
MAQDGRAYLGTIKAIQGDKYKIKYDSNISEVWLTADQFLVTKSSTDPLPNNKQIPKTVQQVPNNNTKNNNNINTNSVQQQTNVNTSPKYKVAQRIELNVDGRGVWYKGFIKEVHFAPNYAGYYLVHLDKGVDTYGGGTEFTVSNTYLNLMRPEGSTADTKPENCAFGPPPGTFTDTSPASVALFKKIVYDKQMMLVNGTMTRPVRIGITFLSFDVAKAYKNTVSIVPGRGAQRINDAAPPNAIIYPATIKYIICEDYNPGIQRRMIEAKHEFYISRFGQWTSSEGAFDKISVLE